MSKVYKMVDLSEPGPSDIECSPIDWTKCVLCQTNTSESLSCPADSKRDSKGTGYKTTAENLLAFEKLGCLPRTITLSRLDEGEGIEASFQHHKAKWHDTCRLKFNKTKLQRAEKRKASPEDSLTSDDRKKFTRRSREEVPSAVHRCFFCDGDAVAGESLHKASTLELDARGRKCALELQDKLLLTKLSSGDMVAQDAEYHINCLVALYNRERASKSSSSDRDVDAINHGIAFAELVSYMEETRVDNLVAPIFKLSDLANLYSRRLEQLGTKLPGRVHSTKLKNRILAYFLDMKAHTQGREVVLVFNEDVGAALRRACEHDADSDAVYLARAATIVRRDMFQTKMEFNGSFHTECQEQSLPTSLLSLVAIVLNGPNIKTQSSSSSVSQPALSISQLLLYNSCKRYKENAKDMVRHSQQRETPLPIYLGIMLHTKTRKRDLVDTLFNLGLCISYDRVLNISTELGDKICYHYEQEKAVCPPELKGGLFTSAAVDNIDHNPSSTTSRDSFHGTGISLFQHPDENCSGIQRVVIANQGDSHPGKSNLPESYTSVPPVVQQRGDPPVPKLQGSNRGYCELIPQAMQREYRYSQIKLVKKAQHFNIDTEN